MSFYDTYGESDGYSVIPLNYFRRLFFQKNYRRVLESLPRESKILEIGPGGGTFAEYLLTLGFRDITLCERSAVIASRLEAHFSAQDGVRVFKGDGIEYLADRAAKFHLIVAMEVIEHFSFPDFSRLLEGIHSALAPGGIALLETNNSANIIYGTYLNHCDHTHRLGFTPRALANALSSVGFNVRQVLPVNMTNMWDVCRSLLQARLHAGEEAAFNAAITHTPRRDKIRLAALFALRGVGIWISKWLSYLFVYPYDVSLGAMHKSVFTPTFAIAARKEGETPSSQNPL
jgi:2-polyprenyl-3-methyl-5-hydroxy-6-metoxy-1,4-benzoquinol methylase